MRRLKGSCTFKGHHNARGTTGNFAARGDCGPSQEPQPLLALAHQHRVVQLQKAMGRDVGPIGRSSDFTIVDLCVGPRGRAHLASHVQAATGVAGNARVGNSGA